MKGNLRNVKRVSAEGKSRGKKGKEGGGKLSRLYKKPGGGDEGGRGRERLNCQKKKVHRECKERKITTEKLGGSISKKKREKKNLTVRGKKNQSKGQGEDNENQKKGLIGYGDSRGL